MRRFALKGFTLIEVLVVVAIIGIISGLSVFGIKDARANARDSVRKSNMEMVASALELYKLDCNKYPDVLPSPGQALTGKNPSGRCKTSNVYIASMPADPQGPSRFYNYYSPPNNKSYELCSSLEKSTGNTVTCGGSSSCGSQITQNINIPKVGQGTVLAVDLIKPPECANKPDGTACWWNQDGSVGAQCISGNCINGTINPDDGVFEAWYYLCNRCTKGNSNQLWESCWQNGKLESGYTALLPDGTRCYNQFQSSRPWQKATCQAGGCVTLPCSQQLTGARCNTNDGIGYCQGSSCLVTQSKSWTIKLHPVCPNGSPVTDKNTTAFYITWNGGNPNSVWDSLATGVHTLGVTTNHSSDSVYVGLGSSQSGSDTFVPSSPYPMGAMYTYQWGGTSAQNNGWPNWAVAWNSYIYTAVPGTYDLNFVVPSSWCGGGPTPTATPTIPPDWVPTPTPQPAACNYKVTSP